MVVLGHGFRSRLGAQVLGRISTMVALGMIDEGSLPRAVGRTSP